MFQFKEYFNLAKNPLEYFKKEKRKETFEALEFFFLPSVLFLALAELVYNSLKLSFFEALQSLFVSLISLSVLLFAGVFLHTFFAHIFIKLLRKPKSFINSFKPVSFGGLVFAVYLSINTLVMALFYFSHLHNTTYSQFITSLIFLVGLVHSLTIEVQGFRFYQKLSVMQSLFIVLIPRIVFYLVVAVLFLIFMIPFM